MHPVLTVNFYKAGSGTEPARDWLMELDRETRKAIGGDIKTVELGWPLGMPLVRKVDTALWEVRSHIPAGIARIFFTTVGATMVLLHGIIKKSGRTPKNDLDIARSRRDEVKNATR